MIWLALAEGAVFWLAWHWLVTVPRRRWLDHREEVEAHEFWSTF